MKTTSMIGIVFCSIAVTCWAGSAPHNVTKTTTLCAEDVLLRIETNYAKIKDINYEQETVGYGSDGKRQETKTVRAFQKGPYLSNTRDPKTGELLVDFGEWEVPINLVSDIRAVQKDSVVIISSTNEEQRKGIARLEIRPKPNSLIYELVGPVTELTVDMETGTPKKIVNFDNENSKVPAVIIEFSEAKEIAPGIWYPTKQIERDIPSLAMEHRFERTLRDIKVNTGLSGEQFK